MNLPVAACVATILKAPGTRIWSSAQTITSWATGAYTVLRVIPTCLMKWQTARWWTNPGRVWFQRVLPTSSDAIACQTLARRDAGFFVHIRDEYWSKTCDLIFCAVLALHRPQQIVNVFFLPQLPKLNLLFDETEIYSFVNGRVSVQFHESLFWESDFWFCNILIIFYFIITVWFYRETLATKNSKITILLFLCNDES